MRALIVFAIACGGKPAPKPPPPEPASTVLARKLDDDMTILADLAHRHAADCIALVTQLRPHVDQMKAHAAEVATMMSDPIQGKALKTALAGYETKAAGRTDAIAKDLGAAYLGCQDATAKLGIERAIADIPTY
jgi:hypothetical protein